MFYLKIFEHISISTAPYISWRCFYRHYAQLVFFAHCLLSQCIFYGLFRSGVYKHSIPYFVCLKAPRCGVYRLSYGRAKDSVKLKAKSLKGQIDGEKPGAENEKRE